MITREEILKLAALSRLSLSEGEVAKMQTEMGSILSYVDKLKSAKIGNGNPVMSVNKNVLREDTNAHGGGIYTEKLINAAPKHEKTKEGLFVKVKKILGGSQ
jgi:aspartyl-tRNA(Asn)/glutamyl-tRNA(Gln) amidotransferase subunit C